MKKSILVIISIIIFFVFIGFMSLSFLTFSTNGDSDSLENIEELNTNTETNKETSDDMNKNNQDENELNENNNGERKMSPEEQLNQKYSSLLKKELGNFNNQNIEKVYAYQQSNNGLTITVNIDYSQNEKEVLENIEKDFRKTLKVINEEIETNNQSKYSYFIFKYYIGMYSLAGTDNRYALITMEVDGDLVRMVKNPENVFFNTFASNANRVHVFEENFQYNRFMPIVDN